ncbi:MAG TPA: PQQ-binding-like beta-propeller repeat protein, partial [Polyangiaceae bacterium]
QPRLRAVARDGTLVVTTKDELSAISNGAVRWRQPLVFDRLFVDSDNTIVAATGTSLGAFDVASGTKAWELPLPKEQVYELASAGPGKVYVLSASSLTLVSD